MGRIYEAYVKRALDVALSGCALVALSPVMGVTALLVRQKLGSPVIFCQERPGKDEQIFKLYKFRTMTDARGADGNLLPDAQRLTPFGRRLRSTSLDELPELWNILRGDMSIVGPRPLLVKYLPYYSQTERRRHAVRPGLTGLAQVNGRNLTSWAERFAYDVDGLCGSHQLRAGCKDCADDDPVRPQPGGHQRRGQRDDGGIYGNGSDDQ